MNSSMLVLIQSGERYLWEIILSVLIKFRLDLDLFGASCARAVPILFFFSSRRRHTRCSRDWSSDVCSSDLNRTDKARRGTAKKHAPESGLIGSVCHSGGALLASSKAPKRTSRAAWSGISLLPK